MMFLSAWSSLAGIAAADERANESQYAFARNSVDGQLVEVRERDDRSFTVICFLGTECPVARSYVPRLSVLAAEFANRGVHFVGVYSNQQDSVDDIRQYLRGNPTSFPLLRDDGNVIADRYEATRTPEVVMLDRSLALRYRGRVDDQYQPGVSRTAATRNDLRTAIEELLAGEPVRVARTEVVGCLIGRVHRAPPSRSIPSAVTYSKQVSRILQAHCVECHRPGEIGPFSLLRYEDAVSWAGTMLEVIENGRMPPWHADPSAGRFANARRLTDDDKQALRDWVAAQMPRGDAADLPAPATFVDGWQLPREPDLVLTMGDRPFQVPAQGTVEYQYFVVDPRFAEDKWITAAQVIPGSHDVVHHAIVFVRPPDGARFRGVGWLTAYVPGQRLAALPDGYARRVPAGSKLVFQMHYTTNGTPRQDLSRVGILFGAAGQVTHEVSTAIGIDQEFEIPPRAASHEVNGPVRWLPDEGTLLAITPHMHLRGKSFRLFADRNARTETLLHVPDYRFDWQHTYQLQEPIPLAEIDRVRFVATFDNTSGNPFNPDPSQWVTWGDQSWEEMAVVFLEVAEPLRKSARAAERSDLSTAVDRERQVQQFVDDFFRELDTNGDGVVTLSEVPLVVRRVSFQRFDFDDDQRVTRDEVRQAAEGIF